MILGRASRYLRGLRAGCEVPDTYSPDGEDLDPWATLSITRKLMWTGVTASRRALVARRKVGLSELGSLFGIKSCGFKDDLPSDLSACWGDGSEVAEVEDIMNNRRISSTRV